MRELIKVVDNEMLNSLTCFASAVKFIQRSLQHRYS